MLLPRGVRRFRAADNFKREGGKEPMRIKTITVVRATAKLIQRILEARLPMAEAAGLRIH
jgi:hypothetical protein